MIHFYIATLVYMAFSAVLFKKTMKYIREIEKRRQEDLKQDREWFFKSLYSISTKVVLPNTERVEIANRKARVFDPNQDPMREFDKLEL